MISPGRAFAAATQLGHASDAGRRGNDERQVQAGERRDGGEVLQRVVRQIGVKGRIHRVAVADHEERVTVRRGLRHHRGPHHAAGPGPVVDHHRLPPYFRELAADVAADEIEAAAGRYRNHHPHRLGGIALGKGARGYEQPGNQQQRKSHTFPRGV